MFINEIMQPVFWLLLGKIVCIDVLLSGDNALVIAMACRGLPPRQRVLGMVLGSIAAVLLRVAITGVVGFVFNYPYLKLLGGLALLFIAIKMLQPDEDDGTELAMATSLLSAIGTVMIADITMSIDNVVAVAAAANGSVLLLALGLAISIPLIVTGAYAIVRILDRFPVLIWAGAALLGYIAGEMAASDPVGMEPLWAPYSFGHDPIVLGFVGATCVLISGFIMNFVGRKAHEQKN
jgi:YjbE family integral membrane protein